MSARLKHLDELIRQLPPASQAEMVNFAEFLLAKRQKQSGKTLRQSWRGALSDLRDSYTSLELQEKSLEWRMD